MSERLEEMIKKHKQCVFNRGVGIYSIKDIEWFIKQAKIGEINKRLLDGQVHQKELAHFENEDLEKQNKRYREALEDIEQLPIKQYPQIRAKEALENK